ncbi:hypothetical protein [Vibrio owensii]|uniref:hypothetical protein n=1 Tax=Vibrio owensii TaxID=696485 RepID=UPI002894BE3A|nr:conserved hypothetical protein [Vibrio owensii]
MNQYVVRHNSLEEPVTTEGYISEINDFLCNHRSMSDEKKKTLPQELKTQFEETCLSDDNLKWIDSKNERLCLWLWDCMKLYSFEDIQLQPEEANVSEELRSFSEMFASTEGIESIADSIERDTKGKQSYITFGLNDSYNTPKEHYDAVITCLDMWQAPVRLKREFNDEHQKLWEDVANYGNFDWFVPVKKKDDEDWFFQYINKGLEDVVQPKKKPWNLSKMVSTAILRFDSWQPDFPREKKYFLKDMRKAWSQKKHRYKMKKDDRKAYSIVMHKDVNNHLEELAKSTGMSKNEFLEMLISSEYKHRVYSGQ